METIRKWSKTILIDFFVLYITIYIGGTSFYIGIISIFRNYKVVVIRVSVNGSITKLASG